MKMFAMVMLSVLTIPAYAQRLLGSLESHQNEITPKSDGKTEGQPQLKVDPVSKTKTSGQCTEEVQTSLPLAYVTSLILEKGGSLSIAHDPRTGKITVNAPEMISNCSSMIEWVPNARVVDGKRIYSIEAKIKEGEDCKDGLCSYDVAKVEKGQFKSFEKVQLKPSMNGFEDCLEKSGVIANGKVVEDAIYPSALSEKFDGFKDGGELLFLSHGPSSKLIKPKYDKFVEVDKCDHYEKITAEGIVLKSMDEEERDRIMSEKEKVRNCGEYDKISDFIQKYQGYSDDLNSIRDNLILEAMKKSAKAISEGNYTEEDLKVLSDFEKYIVQPRIDLANMLYEEAQELSGDEQKQRLTQMKSVQDELAGYNKAPFITAAIVQKLENDGKFDTAVQANGIKALIVAHQKLGAKSNGVVVTPEIAKVNAFNMKQEYESSLEDVKAKYEIRTGQVTGQADAYSQLASQMTRNIQTRTQNFSQEIQEEYARMQQPNGYCYRSPFRNVQKCIQNSMERIQELQAQLQHFNKVDAERAQEYQQKAQEYAKLEKEGRAYVARQNGEEVPEEPETDNTKPQARTNTDGYTFNFQGTGQAQQQQQQYNPYQQQSMNPYQQQNMMTQQYNPYQQFQNPYGQQNYMGQQNYSGLNFGMNYGYNMGNTGNSNYGYNQGSYNPYMQSGMQSGYNPYMQTGMQSGYNPYAQQAGGYWQNPYQAYGNYNMYGYNR